MKLQIGDKVKFLNQTGGGVVSKIVSSQIVNVTDETGFDIPTLIKDLVKVEEVQGAGKLFLQEISVSSSENAEGPECQEDDYDAETAVTRLYRVPESRNVEAGVYLAFVPHDQRWLITGDLDVYLVNRTPRTLFATAFVKAEKSFQNVDYEVIDAESKFYLETITREQVNDWLHAVVQGVFIGKTGVEILSPLSEEVKIKASKFFKEDSYVGTACLGEKAIVVCVRKLSEIRAFAEIGEAKAFAGKDAEPATPKNEKKKSLILNPDNVLEQFFIEPNVAEVDLHIEALADDCLAIPDHEKFEIQMGFFRKCLNDAIVNHVQKVIFIHGVGNGVLKNEIVKELKQYKGLHYFDASMAKYGVGATEVYLSNSVFKEM